MACGTTPADTFDHRGEGVRIDALVKWQAGLLAAAFRSLGKLAVIALAAAVAILVFGPRVDAAVDRWLLPASPTAALQHEVSALHQARRGAVSSASTERHRIERDLHDGAQRRRPERPGQGAALGIGDRRHVDAELFGEVRHHPLGL